jgi:drug/metabolite transporter (DMT)-like permease
VVTIFALAAAALYGTADFLGGATARRASVISALVVIAPTGAVIMLAAALLAGGPASLTSISVTGLCWGIAGGAAGGIGLILFYAGFTSAAMSMVAPVSALVSTLLPVGVAMANGERPSPAVLAGALVCLVAIALVSMDPGEGSGPEGPAPGVPAQARRAGRPVRAFCLAVAAGAAFGLFYLFIRNAGTSGVLWPVSVARLSGTLVALLAAAWTRTRPLSWRNDPAAFRMALASGVLDAIANVCYVLATRAGLFGLAVVITALYPGMTVLLARLMLGERMRPAQRLGLTLAALGVILVTV